ncbi:17280_t:CDS:2, partial [Acaulospora colombiana]
QYLEERSKVFDPKYSSSNKDLLTFVDPEVYRDLRINSDEEFDVQKNKTNIIMEFFTLLAVCHTVVVEEVPSGGENTQDATASGGSDRGDVSVTGPSETTSFVNMSQTDVERNPEINHSVIDLAVEKIKNSLKDIIPTLKSINSVPNLRKSSTNSQTNLAPVDKTVVRNIVYKAESPDESALVSAAKNLGFTFLSRNTDLMTIDIFGNEYTFEILNILEFNSTRKRMSVVTRRPAELGGGIVLFCKGADNVIIERLAEGQDVMVERTMNDIVEFSNDGLRTLTLAYRVLSETQYNTWSVKYQVAATSVNDRSNKIDAVSDEIERELILLGATAIEDKLQEGVPASISSLREGGCKVWVLTGDNLETALNIRFAAQLLTKEMTLHIVRGSNKTNAMKELSDIEALLKTKEMNDGEDHAFVVDGAG